MTGSNQTYDSSIPLNLGQIPESITDPELYQELLDIHDAIEALANRIGTGMSSDFYLELSKGNVEGHSSISKFGVNGDLDAGSGFETIWDGGAVYVPPTVASLHDVASTLAADAGTILISGSAASGSETTLVDTNADFVSAGVAIGDHVLNDTQNVIGVISAFTATTLTLAGSMRNPEDGLRDSANEAGDSYRIVTNTTAGASYIFINGLDSNYLEASEFIVLNGTTNVPTTKLYIRQFRARAFGPNADETAGVVTSTSQVGSTVSCQIDNGSNQSLMCIYTVPVNKTAYLTKWQGSITTKTSASATMILRAGTLDGIGYILQVGVLNTAGGSDLLYEPTVPLKISGGVDIWVEGESDTNNTGVASGFDIVLVDD